jgi:predicted metal-binding protein
VLLVQQSQSQADRNAVIVGAYRCRQCAQRKAQTLKKELNNKKKSTIKVYNNVIIKKEPF